MHIALTDIWRDVAYMTRYGRCTMTEALNMPADCRAYYIEQVSELVGKENGD